MEWHLYTITFRLKSPLHIGFHKVMHLFRTRPYVPARPFWGALTAKLARKLNLDYIKAGDFLKKSMRFGYFYVYNKDQDAITYMPKYSDEGLKFGNLNGKELLQIEFEKRFISSLTSASIESFSLTAEEGMLHEVEYISPYEICKEITPKPSFLRGLLWVREMSENGISIQINENNFSIIGNGREVIFPDLINTLQVGGERKYGFGLLELTEIKESNDRDLENLGFKGRWKEKENENNVTNVIIELKEDDPVWSHIKYNSNLKIKGRLEPVVGRYWGHKGAGKKLVSYGLCWVPGSILTENKALTITENFGLWNIEI